MNEEQICPQCGHVSPAGSKFCNECGYRFPPPNVPVYCPACGLENPPNSKFCNECGTPLSIAQSKPVPPPPVVESAASAPPERTQPSASTYAQECRPSQQAPTSAPKTTQPPAPPPQVSAAPPDTQTDGATDSGQQKPKFFGKKDKHLSPGQVMKNGQIWNVGPDGVLYREENGEQFVDAESFFEAQQARKAQAEAVPVDTAPATPEPEPEQPKYETQPHVVEPTQPVYPAQNDEPFSPPQPQQPWPQPQPPDWSPEYRQQNGAYAPDYEGQWFPPSQQNQPRVTHEYTPTYSEQTPQQAPYRGEAYYESPNEGPRGRNSRSKRGKRRRDDEDEDEQSEIFSFLQNGRNSQREAEYEDEPSDYRRQDDSPRSKRKREKEEKPPKLDFRSIANADGYYDDRMPIDNGDYDSGPKKNWLPTILMIVGIIVVAGILIWAQSII